MKHLLSILIFFSFMSVASAEVYLCKVDNSSGLNFDWEKREYYKTHFINSEYLIKVVDDTKCHEIIVGKDKYYTKKLDRTANIDGSEYRCLNHSITHHSMLLLYLLKKLKSKLGHQEIVSLLNRENVQE